MHVDLSYGREVHTFRLGFFLSYLGE